MQYIFYSISITFFSWIAGMFLNELIKGKPFYDNISNLNFIKNGSINKMIGMDIFRWAVKNTFFKYFNDKLKLKTKCKGPELTVLRKEMTFSEISHLIGFVLVVFVAVFLVFSKAIKFGITLLIVNVLLNLYPSLLQQRNKMRIDKLLKNVSAIPN